MNTPKADLSPTELEALRDALLTARARARGDVNQLEADATREHDGLSLAPASQSDPGKEMVGMQMSAALEAREQNLLWAIEHALDRMHAGTYGLCEESGRPIGLERLRAKPWARFTVEVERQHEASGR